jgi:hypothetical protein
MMMDGDVEKEISPNDDAWKVFLCRLSRRRWSEKATTLTFFHDFLVKPPKRKVAAAAAFLTRPLRREGRRKT